MITVHPNDIPYDLAVTAHSGISMEPERRAQQVQQEYVAEMQTLYDALLPLAETDAQRAVFDAEMERYRAGYVKHMLEVLAARGRTLSWFITGRDNFPIKRNEKATETEQRRVNEFLAWRDRARPAIKRAILDARAPEAKHDAVWNKLRGDLLSSLGMIAAIDAGERGWDRGAFVSGITSKIERLTDPDLVARALDLVREYNATHTKPAITTRHRIWTLTITPPTPAGEPVTLIEVTGAQVIDNPIDNRIQIVFDDKPDATTRSRLKAAGWRWSPNAGAWQRQRTEAARASAQAIVGA